LINEKGFAEIRSGMTKTDVIAKLGKPPGDYTTCAYAVNDAFEPFPPPHCDWITDEWSITVYYDKMGRVNDKKLRTVFALKSIRRRQSIFEIIFSCFPCE
jgi:hypothetical protein